MIQGRTRASASMRAGTGRGPGPARGLHEVGPMTHSTASLRNPTDDKLTGRRLAGRRLAGRRLSGRRLTGTVTALSLSLCACTVEVQPEAQGGLEGAQPASASNVERDRSSLGS